MDYFTCQMTNSAVLRMCEAFSSHFAAHLVQNDRQQQKQKNGDLDHRLYRLERYLAHWRILPPAQKVLRHEENGHHLLLTEHHPPYSHARRGKGSEPVIYRKVTLFGRQGFMLTLF